MDIQRYLLIAASAALAIILLGEWTAFRAENSQVEDRVRLAQPQSDNSIPSDTTALEKQAPSDTDELPDVTEIIQSNEPMPQQDSASSLITVTTDTLQLVIDLVGGDIVEAGLPRFPDNIENPDVPFVILEKNNTRTYVAQSGFVGRDGIDTPERAIYRSDQMEYLQVGNQPLTVTLTTIDTQKAVEVTKTFTFTANSYLVNISYGITNNGNARWDAVPFAQLKRDSTLPPAADTSGFGMQPFLGAATTTTEDRFKKFSFGDIADEPWKNSYQGGWIAIMQHYFLSAWIPSANQSHTYSTRQTQAGFNIAGFTSSPVIVDPGQTGSYSMNLYVGPKDQYTLAEISPHLELTVDYGWLWWIAQPLFWLLTKIQSFVGNWGVAIILLTVFVKGAFFKLSAASYRSMAKMRKVQPKMQSIREEYADDKQKQSQAMMELYKKEKINPMGGCLPILIQMPVFIALYWVLMESVELRQAPFALWINDLSVMDPYFVLPLMMGASMFFMQKLNPPPPDPMQAKIMQWLPVIFTFFFLWFPAGLVLYWVVNNLLSMTQQFIITRAIDREGLKH